MHCKRIREVDFRSGVSLTELLVVISIIIVLAVLSVPSLSRALIKSNLEKQTDFLTGIIVTSRIKSMEQGCQWLIDFDSTNNTFNAFGDKNSNGSYDSGEDMLGPYRLENNISFGSTAEPGPNNSEIPQDGISFVDNRLILNMFGSSNSGTIYLKKDTKTYALRVLPASGTVVCWLYDGTWRKK